MVYYDGIRYSFMASTGVAFVAIISSLVARAHGLRKTSG